MQGKVVNDIIQEWNTELEKRSRAFVRHAEELMEWDRAILSNRHTLLDLEDEVKRVSCCMLNPIHKPVSHDFVHVNRVWQTINCRRRNLFPLPLQSTFWMSTLMIRYRSQSDMHLICHLSFSNLGKKASRARHGLELVFLASLPHLHLESCSEEAGSDGM